jgi:uncharacterized protein
VTTVVVVADTHLPRFGRDLPAPLVRGLTGVDLVLHAGDITDAFVLDLLEAFAPVIAVAGNNDGPALHDRLGTRRIVEVGAVRIGLTHGHLGTGRSTPERARLAFAREDPPVDAVAFGHSHQPMSSASAASGCSTRVRRRIGAASRRSATCGWR